MIFDFWILTFEFVLDWFIPQTIDLVDSKINGRIKVVKEFGHVSVVVDGYQQSGDMIEKIWRKALTEGLINNQRSQVKKILILGLGTGTVLPVLSDLFVNTQKIIGVEIDEEMIKIGKKHFSLNKTEKLEIEIGDAAKVVSKINEKFDLILVDTYKGNIFSVTEFMPFLQTLEKVKISGGAIVINFLDFKSNLTEAQLLHLLEKPAKIVKVEYNWFAFV